MARGLGTGVTEHGTCLGKAEGTQADPTRQLPPPPPPGSFSLFLALWSFSRLFPLPSITERYLIDSLI